MAFFDLLEARVAKVDSLLCVGLDPHAAQLPEPTAAAALQFCKRLIDATKQTAAAYKPNAAFFEALGPEGWQALKDVVAMIPADIPVLLDAKRGDISTTADAYATAALQDVKATGVTLHGYMGRDSVEPFLKDPRCGVFLLCKTSNPSSNEVQTLTCVGKDGQNRAVFEEMALLASAWDRDLSGGKSRVGLVVGATDIDALKRVRALVPDMWILAPGIGAQGGDLEAACEAGMSAGGSKLLLPISRGISKPEDPAQAAEGFRAAISEARRKKVAAATGAASDSAGLKPYQRDFISFAMERKVLCLGSFILKSGRNSPYFFNAGLFTTGAALKRLGSFYARAILDAGLEYDVLFGPAYKGITLVAAVSSALWELSGRDVPFAYNRKEAKDHGEGGVVVGADMKDKRVLIVDDVITAGTAIRQSMDLLASVQARPVGVALALDRQEKGGDTPLSAVQSVQQEFGLHVVSIVGLNQLLAYLQEGGASEAAGSLEAIRKYREQYGVSEP